MKLGTLLHRKVSNQRSRSSGFSMPEMMVSSFILATFVTLGTQLTNSTTDGMKRTNLRSKLDSAMALRMEEIRHCAFFYLLDSSLLVEGEDCRSHSFDLTQQLSYDLDSLAPLCSANTIGTSLSSHLSTEGLGGNFNLQDYDDAADSEIIQATLTPAGNQLKVLLSATSIPLKIQSTIVPHAQGWCR